MTRLGGTSYSPAYLIIGVLTDANTTGDVRSAAPEEVVMHMRRTTAVILGFLLALSIGAAQEPKAQQPAKAPGTAAKAPGTPAKAPSAPATDFKALMQKTLEAWSTMDVDKVAPLYDPAAGHVYYDIAPLKYADWKAYAEGAKKLFADYSAVKITMNPDAKAVQRGNTAYGTATSHVEMTKKDGGKEAFDARWTVIWEKRGDDWTIVHDHFSTPLPEPAPPKPAGKKK